MVCRVRFPAVAPLPREQKEESMSEITVDEAVSVIRRDYYRDVLSLARDLAERMKAGEIDDFGDALHEQVDGCARVIYTFQAKLGLLASDNEEAWQEVGADCTEPEQRMYYALQADITERLVAAGVDLDDSDSWAEIDLGGFE